MYGSLLVIIYSYLVPGCLFLALCILCLVFVLGLGFYLAIA